MEKLKNTSLCPPSAPQQLVRSGGLGFDCLINHMVWTAGLKRKLHVSRPGAVLWSNDQGQGLYYSAPPTQICSDFTSGRQDTVKNIFPSSHLHHSYSQPQCSPWRMSSYSVRGQLPETVSSLELCHRCKASLLFQGL